MKKAFAFLLILALLLSTAGCTQYAVQTPLEYPDYTFTDTPDTTQLRKTAVAAMRNNLTIQWSPGSEISYFNTAGRDKQFNYLPKTTYGGLLYSGAGSGLFQFLEFYDPQTGLLNYPGTTYDLKTDLGSGCADALLWGWNTVCNSFYGGHYPSFMVYKNGYLPVGDYTYNESTESYYLMPTKAIIEQNGVDVMLDSYCKMLPADALVSSSDDHAMMVIEVPTVQYLPDGSVDTANSYVLIQDQRGGNTSTTFYEVTENGHTVHYNGRTSFKFTFQELLEKNYIPVTTAEFLGTKAYEKAEVTVNGTCANIQDLLTKTVQSNYPLAVVNVLAFEAEGTQTVIARELFSAAGTNGAPRSYCLDEFDTLESFDSGSYTGIKIEVVVSTGERFIPIDFTL